ncbi:hypothetical protein QQ008_09765 [Fulvivirgaceae bacterium BMA10]|uniref:Polysaccharide chain length determinant N-terminal domain-containing protein n=1 Tax=Splendidivirga corallicola TaxID=3051826 RepID=A0ABT8KLP9_9BACT|nr:hypothetical protein [Fulvivirgaceae bacterium BMA10]
MSLDQNNLKKKNEDEIDLNAVFGVIILMFVKIGKAIINTISYLRRLTINYKFFIISTVLVGLAIAYLSNRTSKEYYKSSMLLSSKYFNGRLIESTIEKLNILTAERNKSQLAKVLKVPNEIASSIIKFESEPFVSENEIVELEVLKEQLKNAGSKEEDIEKVLRQLEIENRYTYQINIFVYESKVISELTNPIVNYFRSNEYIKKRILNNEKTLLARKNKIQSEINSLDSLKTVVINNIASLATKNSEGSNNVILAEQTNNDLLGVYQESILLHNRQLGIEEELALKSDFELIDGFTISQKPENINLKTILIYAALISLGIAYALLLLFEINKQLARIEREKKELEAV